MTAFLHPLWKQRPKNLSCIIKYTFIFSHYLPLYPLDYCHDVTVVVKHWGVILHPEESLDIRFCHCLFGVGGKHQNVLILLLLRTDITPRKTDYFFGRAQLHDVLIFETNEFGKEMLAGECSLLFTVFNLNGLVFE